MRAFLFAIILSAVFISGTAYAQYPGTNLRGQIVSAYNGQAIPSAQVNLYFYNSYYQNWVIIASAYTDANGFYYFQYVVPGFYVIQVNQVKNYNIQVVMINYNYYTYQDLPLLYF